MFSTGELTAEAATAGQSPGITIHAKEIKVPATSRTKHDLGIGEETAKLEL